MYYHWKPQMTLQWVGCFRKNSMDPVPSFFIRGSNGCNQLEPPSMDRCQNMHWSGHLAASMYFLTSHMILCYEERHIHINLFMWPLSTSLAPALSEQYTFSMRMENNTHIPNNTHTIFVVTAPNTMITHRRESINFYAY